MAKFIKFDTLDLNSTKAAAAIVKVLGHFFRGPVDKCPPDSVECLAAVVAIQMLTLRACSCIAVAAKSRILTNFGNCAPRPATARA